MKYLPFENITFRTKLRESEIINRLSRVIDPEKTFRFGIFGSGSTKFYKGQITGQTFEIKRIIGYRNSFLPRIKGIIKSDFDGTTIKIKMRLSCIIIIFLCFWCSGVGLLCFNVLPQKIRNSEFDFTLLIPLLMLLFVYALTMVGFKLESNKAKINLQEIFEADILDQ